MQQQPLSRRRSSRCHAQKTRGAARPALTSVPIFMRTLPGPRSSAREEQDHDTRELGIQWHRRCGRSGSGRRAVGPSGRRAVGAAGPTSEALALALERNSALTRIDLANNNIGDVGAQARKASRGFPCLAFTKSFGACCQALAAALKLNNTMKDLDLRYNEIGDAGAQAQCPRGSIAVHGLQATLFPGSRRGP